MHANISLQSSKNKRYYSNKVDSIPFIVTRWNRVFLRIKIGFFSMPIRLRLSKIKIVATTANPIIPKVTDRIFEVMDRASKRSES